MTPEVEAFAAEYRALCEKHGLILVFDGGYIVWEVARLASDDFDEGWRLVPTWNPGEETT